MFELYFGIFWTGFIAFFTLIILFSEGFSLLMLPLLLFLLPFWIIGIVLLKKGITTIRINRETDTFGENCYGIITNIYENGKYTNDIPELSANVVVFIPSLYQVKEITEVLGMANKVRDYDIGSYVMLKYYNGDINFEISIDESYVPQDIKKELDSSANINRNDTIIIDGIEYVRKNSLNPYNIE